MLISHAQDKTIETRTGKYTKTQPSLPDRSRNVVLGLRRTRISETILAENQFGNRAIAVAMKMIGQNLLHYQILEELGKGGMGEVYVANDTKLNRKVAVKILPDSTSTEPTVWQRLQREAHAIAALNHPNIVTIYSVEESDGRSFLTMELVEGSTLENVIPAGGLAMEDFFQLAIEISDAVSAAHQHGIVHRDLKPANVMVTRDGRAKVLDFGLAKLRDPQEKLPATTTTQQPLTAAGAVLGTIPYMSPEQLTGASVDHRSDIFSLGIIFFEMCTGTRPFQAGSAAETISAILRDSPMPASELNRQCPVRLAQAVEKCLRKAPKERYQTTSALRDDLQRIREAIRQGTAGEINSSIAVLPFVDMSQEKDQAYFCDGLAEELINALTKIRNLKVAARTSTIGLSGPDTDVRQIGKQLAVDTVLKGSVRKSKEQLRITAQLINVADGYLIWSEQYDRTLQDIFEIQNEIAHRIVHLLEPTVSSDETRISPRPGTQDPQAYDYYLRGRKFFYQHLRKGFRLALKMFTMAIDQDPGFAKAYAGIADCNCFIYLYYDGGRRNLQEADQASQRAIELGMDMAETHASRGGVLSILGQHQQAEAEFERSIELGPQLFDAYYLFARDCYTRGNLEKAATLYSRAAEVDPDDFQSRLLLAQVCDDLGRRSQAEAARRAGVEIVARRLLTNPDDVRALYLGANGLVGLGQLEKGLEWTSLALSIAPHDSYVLYNVACIYSLAGKYEEALGFLEQTLEYGLTKSAWIDRDSNLDPLREMPRFKAIRARLTEIA